MQTRTRKKLFLVVALTLMLSLGGLVGLYHYLPRYVETRLIPQVARSFGLDPREVRVRRITFSGIELGPIRLAAGGRTALALETLRLDYNLSSLVHDRILGITLEGLRLDIRFDRDGLTVAGIPLPRTAQPEPAQTQALDLRTLLPMALDHVAVRRAFLDVAWADKQVEIPLEIEADTSSLPQGKATALVRLTPGQSRLDLDVRLDSVRNQWHIDLQKLSIDLRQYADFLPPLEQFSLKGTLLAAGEARGTLSPARPDQYTLAGELDGVEIGPAQAVIANSTNENPPLPIRLKIQSETPGRLRWSLSPLEIHSEVLVRIPDLAGDLSFDGGQWSLQAKALTALPAQRIQLANDQTPELKTPVTLAWNLEARSNSRDGLTFDLGTTARDQENPGPSPVSIELRPWAWTGTVPEIRARGSQGPEGLDVRYRLDLPRNTISLPEDAAATAALTAEGRLTAGNGITCDLQFSLSDGVLRDRERQAAVNNLSCDLHAVQTESKAWSLSGLANLKDARFIDSGLRLIAKQINARLPIAWPAPARATPGSLSVGAIQWEARRMGDLQGRLAQQGAGLAFDLRHRSKLFENLYVYLKGKADHGGADIDVRLPAYIFEQEVDLGDFTPAAEGYFVKGRLEARSRVTYRNGQTGGTASVKFDQGLVRNEKQKLVLSGIQTGIDLEDLAHVRSRAGQVLRVDRIQLDQIRADDLVAAFQITSAESLRIEKAVMNWCRGTIGFQDVTLDAGRRDLALTLDCRGINLAMMLEQLGVAEGSGDAAVTGRIPVHWSRGNLSFDKGFLSSPPGQSGTIQLRKLKGSQQLLEGLPPDTPQRVQMDIAMEALKDYTYHNVDLRLESEADVLTFKLELEGKPNQLLPFAYDKDLGQFKRIQGKGQADFKGIGIDLNLRSPFNEILNYKKLFNPKSK